MLYLWLKQVPNIHTFIHSFIPLAHAECDNSLPFSGASSVPLCYTLFPANLFQQLFLHPPYFILPLFLHLPLNPAVPKFIHNTFLGILFPSILCTCPNQHNLFNLIVCHSGYFFLTILNCAVLTPFSKFLPFIFTKYLFILP